MRSQKRMELILVCCDWVPLAAERWRFGVPRVERARMRSGSKESNRSAGCHGTVEAAARAWFTAVRRRVRPPLHSSLRGRREREFTTDWLFLQNTFREKG